MAALVLGHKDKGKEDDAQAAIAALATLYASYVSGKNTPLSRDDWMHVGLLMHKLAASAAHLPLPFVRRALEWRA
jgi:hypothetical protein